MVKTLEREIVHGSSQIATWSNLLCKRKKVTYELLIIDQLAKDLLCSLKEIIDQSSVNPWINGRYDLRDVEPSDHSMSRTYRDHRIRIFTNAY